MRISTTQVFRQGIEAFGEQQSRLAKLQQQIPSGVRLTKPSDDPAASSRVLQLEQTISLKEQYQVNISLGDSRLNVEESTLIAVENIAFRLKELAIQGNSGSMDSTSLQAISGEVKERLKELLSLGNTRDSSGDFLFAGYQNNTQPFTQMRTGSIPHVAFNGDQGQRSLQISESRQIVVDNSGSEVFMQIPSTIALNELADVGNAGTGVVAPAQVFDASVYVPGDYEIRFNGPGPGVYDVFDVTAGTNIVTGATYIDSTDIDFQGIRTSITGTPAVGDTFTISPGQYKNIFESIQVFTNTLDAPVSNTQKSANIAEFLTDLENFFTRVLEVRTSIGGRLNALDTQKDANEANIVVTKSTLSTLRDTDLAEAISQFTLEQTTLDAAQSVFARITSSSLFNFLR